MRRQRTGTIGADGRASVYHIRVATNTVTTRLALAALLALLALDPAPARAFDLRFATENDFLTRSNSDDLYTFSVALSADQGPYTFSLRENAFTDREVDLRFDETHLMVRRAVPGLWPWSLSAAAGVAHVGHGLFGQGAQNALHRLIGDEELDLRYVGSRLYPSLAVDAERSFAAGPGLEVGPRLEAASVPGFRSHAVLGAQARWQASDGLALHALLGGQATDSSFAPLERHLASLAPIARLGLVVRDLVFVSWTYNDYGDEREHVTVGLRIAGGNREAGSGLPR